MHDVQNVVMLWEEYMFPLLFLFSHLFVQSGSSFDALQSTVKNNSCLSFNTMIPKCSECGKLLSP